MEDKLTQKQENFCLNIFQGLSQRGAYLKAGYSKKNKPETLDNHACQLANTDKVKARLGELNKKTQNDKVMSVTERKEVLSEIARGNLTDYQEAGLDGAGYILITKSSPNTRAIAGIESATKFDEEGNTGTLFTKVKLHDPVKAIDLLNKMDNLYSDNPIVNVDNRETKNTQIIIGDTDVAEALAILINAGAVRLDAPQDNKTAIESVHPS